MGAGNSVQFDPTVPPGSESLQNGPKRFYAIAGNILRLFGYLGTVAETFDSPITSVYSPDTAPELLLANDPTQAMSAVTKQYADGRAMQIAAVGGPLIYTFDLAGWTPTTSAIYEFSYTGTAYAGVSGPSLSVNGGTPIAIVKADGSAIADPNDLLPGTIYPMAYDGASFRILGFLGGTLVQPLILAADPTVNLGAATKEYVDFFINLAVVATQASALTANSGWLKVPLTGGAQLIVQWASQGQALNAGGIVVPVGLAIPFPGTMLFAVANAYNSASMDNMTAAWDGSLAPQTVNVACNVGHSGGVNLHVIAIGV